jgi:hypothetical protein
LLLARSRILVCGAGSVGTHDQVFVRSKTFYVVRNMVSSSTKGGSPYLYPPERGWSSYINRHWVPFSSSRTTRRATVEVLKPPPHWVNRLPVLCRSRSLLPATSRHAHTWHRAPLGSMAIYLFNVKTFVLFFLSLILLIDKGGVGLLYIYRMVFTYYTLLHMRLLLPPLRVLEECIYI